MNIELKKIAQRKLDQMGATVHGVLVKNEAGAWAAVSDAGRVMWLDDFEGKASRAQQAGGGEAEVPFAYHCIRDGRHVFSRTLREGDAALWQLSGAKVTPLYTRSSASVPEGAALIPLDPRNGKPKLTNEMKAQCIGEFSWQEDAPYYDEDGDVHEYTATHEVPWDLCKRIYQGMAEVAMLSTETTPQPEGEYENLHRTIETLTKQLVKAEQGSVPELMRTVRKCESGHSFPCNPGCEDFGYCYTEKVATPAPSVPERLIELATEEISDAAASHQEGGEYEPSEWASLVLSMTTPQPNGDGWISEVIAERHRQDQKWGGPEHDDQKSPNDFVQHIEDYAGWARVMAGMGSFVKYRRRMIQVAALAGAAVEAADRALVRANPPAEQEGE